MYMFSLVLHQGFGDEPPDEDPGLDPLPVALLFVVALGDAVVLPWVSFETASSSAFTLS